MAGKAEGAVGVEGVRRAGLLLRLGGSASSPSPPIHHYRFLTLADHCLRCQ